MKKPNFNEPQYQKPPNLVPEDDLQFLMSQRKIKKSPSQSPEITREDHNDNEDYEEEPFNFGGTVGDDSDDEDVDFRIPDENFDSNKGDRNSNNFFSDIEETSKEISLTENEKDDNSSHPFFNDNMGDMNSRNSTTSHNDEKPNNKGGGGGFADMFSNIGSMFGGKKEQEETTDDTLSIASSSYSRKQRRAPPRRHKTPEEIAEEKQELLYRLDKLSKKFPLSKKFTMQSDLEDLKKEYNKLNKRKKLEKSIESQSQYLMWGTTGIEYINKLFNPLKFKLDGWSDLIKSDLDKGKYDDIFEELHEKYGEKIKMAPELDLITMVAGSGFMYHMSQQMTQQMPGMEEIFKKRPDLKDELMKAQMNEAKENEGGSPLKDFMFNAAERQMGGGNGGMKGPSMADDILKKFGSRGMDATQTETTGDTQQFRFT